MNKNMKVGVALGAAYLAYKIIQGSGGVELGDSGDWEGSPASGGSDSVLSSITKIPDIDLPGIVDVTPIDYPKKVMDTGQSYSETGTPGETLIHDAVRTLPSGQTEIKNSTMGPGESLILDSKKTEIEPNPPNTLSDPSSWRIFSWMF